MSHNYYRVLLEMDRAALRVMDVADNEVLQNVNGKAYLSFMMGTPWQDRDKHAALAIEDGHWTKMSVKMARKARRP